ncbi:rhomboid family intramembrane serine protease [Epilithonimonas hungarica]|uniref:Membrane associated serine protease, rhomboid family n=1 Tax=Epilithonimonas hungarica TaxID=454006 RepID=A0A1G7M2Y9_9FLAO|nr:rhomboid family intramembrane serine protease [Epilithonimonas hungarica]MDP9954897.1 membrane associated rhomboid family serine protease [Epilithonimonas hungarica]SDF56162.1 Membrane associated serine protease, rhomboid family [Epilithonimonas hungarica]
MNIVLLIIIVITCVTSYIGFQQPELFQKYKFEVGSIQRRKEYIRLLSAGFLHADFMHLLFNMYTLYIFAPIVLIPFNYYGAGVGGFGVGGFLIIYFGSIILGNLFCLYHYKNVPFYSAIGASGGVSGILFAAVALAPMDIRIWFIPGFAFGAIYFGYSVYMMLNPRMNDNIGHAAHLGGAFFGLVYAVIAYPELAQQNALYIGIMALPLIYLAYEIFVKKRIG